LPDLLVEPTKPGILRLRRFPQGGFVILQRLCLVPVLSLLARPSQRRIQRHAINPGTNEDSARKRGIEFQTCVAISLNQVLTIVRPEAVSMDNFEEQTLVPAQPFVENSTLFAYLHYPDFH